MARVGERRVRAGVGAAVAAAALASLMLLTPTPAGAGGADCQKACDDIDDWSVTAPESRAGYRRTHTTFPPAPELAASATTTRPPASRPVAGAGKSPAGRAGADPAGGVSSEVVAWLMGFGVLLVVWCLAWRWRPDEARMVVPHGSGQRDQRASDDDPRPVHIRL
jgi:hypothetical protein